MNNHKKLKYLIAWNSLIFFITNKPLATMSCEKPTPKMLSDFFASLPVFGSKTDLKESKDSKTSVVPEILLFSGVADFFEKYLNGAKIVTWYCDKTDTTESFHTIYEKHRKHAFKPVFFVDSSGMTHCFVYAWVTKTDQENDTDLVAVKYATSRRLNKEFYNVVLKNSTYYSSYYDNVSQFFFWVNWYEKLPKNFENGTMISSAEVNSRDADDYDEISSVLKKFVDVDLCATSFNATVHCSKGSWVQISVKPTSCTIRVEYFFYLGLTKIICAFS